MSSSVLSSRRSSLSRLSPPSLFDHLVANASYFFTGTFLVNLDLHRSQDFNDLLLHRRPLGIFETCSQSHSQSFTASYLINKLGFSQESALKFSKHVLFKTQRNLTLKRRRLSDGEEHAPRLEPAVLSVEEFDKMFPSEDTDLVGQNYNTEPISVNVESSSAQTPLRVSPNDVEPSSAVPNNATPSSSKPPIVSSSTAESTYTFGVEAEEEVLN
ncbi:hypothetical protein COLO4_28782 [Corchorus olitorius]|uniref:Uncharacterized protein n=1 Tax=Corchorus olitorius TaxID=93759 RepID=A0A1R3HIC3_9ROSI|nr:hypothetical protein COLO4_28782 [Corchorus olitorius]